VFLFYPQVYREVMLGAVRVSRPAYTSESQNRSPFFETGICDFRRDGDRADCSAPPNKPVAEHERRAFRFETDV
jgi:hypothetical protein